MAHIIRRIVALLVIVAVAVAAARGLRRLRSGTGGVEAHPPPSPPVTTPRAPETAPETAPPAPPATAARPSTPRNVDADPSPADRRELRTPVTAEVPAPSPPNTDPPIADPPIADPTVDPVAPTVDPVEGACPATHPIKAKVASGIYHVPGGLSYQRTSPDRCYRDASAAEADGFRAAKR